MSQAHARYPPSLPQVQPLSGPATMAPGISSTVSQHISQKETVSKSIFPDGIKTSGQHPPIYEDIKPVEAFPNEIEGATVWNADDYKHNPERWTHPLVENEIEELSKAADDFKAAGTPLTGITKVFFPSALAWTIGIVLFSRQNRGISPSPPSRSGLDPFGKSSLTVKVSSSSRASRLKSGETTSPQSRTWVWEPI